MGEEKERSKGDHKILWFQWRSIVRKKKIAKDVECGEERDLRREKRERGGEAEAEVLHIW